MTQKFLISQSLFTFGKYFFIGIVVCGTLFSCQKEQYSTSSSDRLHFSADTIVFDTIFTERGSITHQFKVYNHNKGTVRIDEICINQSQNNEFFMNVNGVSGGSVKGMELAAGDSLYIFVQAKLNENAADTPHVHTDSILFRYNNRYDKIVLAAWGQDAYVLKGKTIDENTTWSGRKPYVIFDSLVVNAGQTLTIEEGVSVYLHNRANIIVRGSLQVKGSFENQVVFTSDRLEESFQLLPGQWGSIIFEETSANNTISYAQIKNAVNGLLLQGTQTPIDLRIENSHITNMSSHAIFAQNAHIDCCNTVLANCSGYLAAFHGGRFAFTHTTLSNLNALTGRNTAYSVFVSNTNPATQDEIAFEKSYFRNSIITGERKNEILITPKNTGDVLPVVFDNCLLRQTFAEKEAVYYKENSFITDADLKQKKPLFSNGIKTPFALDSLSLAIDKGNLEYAKPFEFDILQHSRLLDQKPDMGAYEFFNE